jgi:hypothetical protein
MVIFVQLVPNQEGKRLRAPHSSRNLVELLNVAKRVSGAVRCAAPELPPAADLARGRRGVELQSREWAMRQGWAGRPVRIEHT